MEIQRKSTTPSSSSFPTDLTTEILLRLPLKSIVRFRCVSRFWLSITTDPYFNNLLKTRNPRLLICFREDDELVVSSIPQHTLSLDQNSRNSKSYSQPTHTYRMKFPGFSHHVPPTVSVHGLICFRTYTMVIVWNPSTRKFLTLPKPSKSWGSLTTFLGYDSFEAKHKVIAFHKHGACKVCRVITLGGSAQAQEEESWRIVKTNQKHTPYFFNNNPSGQCINGVIYYIASTYRAHPRVWFIMRFDVRSEKFDVVQLPSDIHVDELITYEGKLACVHKEESTKKNAIALSILEDEEENKWSSKEFIAPFCHHDQSLQRQFLLIGFTHAGEFIYRPFPLNMHALLFDPVRNSFRRFGFNGMEDDEELWHQYPPYIFPNHIESLLSL